MKLILTFAFRKIATTMIYKFRAILDAEDDIFRDIAIESNNTLEDLYKKAVKEKYEEAKNGDDFFFLNAPTRGKLNKLCWEKFTNNDMHSNDLNVFNSLLGISFDINSKNKFKKEADVFRPVEKFFKGETDPDKIEVVDMAAILVDFQPRPFNKFRRKVDDEDFHSEYFFKDIKLRLMLKTVSILRSKSPILLISLDNNATQLSSSLLLATTIPSLFLIITCFKSPFLTSSDISKHIFKIIPIIAATFPSYSKLTDSNKIPSILKVIPDSAPVSSTSVFKSII